MDIADTDYDNNDFATVVRQLSTSRRDPRSVRLAAVTSALLEVVEELSASQMYAKVVTALEGTLMKEEGSFTADAIATQVALLEVLTVTLPYMTHQKAIVTSTLPLTARVLRALVTTSREAAVMETKDELGGINALLRWTCRSVSKVLQQLTRHADAGQVKALVEGTLLILMNDRRPKVRKEAVVGLSDVLCSNDCPREVRKVTTHYAHAILSSARKAPGNHDRLVDVVHLLPFLETSIFSLDLDKLLEDIMELFAVLVQVDSSHAATADFAAFSKMKDWTPKTLAINAVLTTVTTLLKDTDPSRKQQLDAMAPRVLASLLQAKPSLVLRHGTADNELLDRGRTQWGQCILTSYIRVSEVNAEVALRLLPLAVQVIVLLSKPSDDNCDDTTVAQELMVELSQALRLSIHNLIQSSGASIRKGLQESLSHLAHVMDPLYRPTWTVSLQTLVLMIQLSFQQLDVQHHVHLLLALRNQVPAGSPSQHAVEAAFVSLVQGVGIEDSWKWIDWQPASTDGKVDMEQAWILPKLKLAMSAAQPKAPRLVFFQSEILVAARSCDKLAATAKKNRAFHQARVMDFWALFPFFCVGPSDLEASLSSIAATCARAMDDSRYPQLLPIICHGLKNLAMLPEQQTTEAVVISLQHTATSLLPTLFKIVTNGREQQPAASQADESKMDVDPPQKATTSAPTTQDNYVSEAISAMAKFAPKDFLQSLFKKLVHRLLEEVQSDSCDDDKLCSYLSLSQSLVASAALADADISLLYRALKPLIRTDEYKARVQKRAYKVLFEICQRYHALVARTEMLDELVSLLTDTMATSQISARYMRLKCILIIINGLGDDVSPEQMKSFLKATPEIMLCLKDTNAKTRTAAVDLMSALASKGGLTEFTKIVASALGAQTVHMRSAAVVALSRLVYEFAWDDVEMQSNLPSLLTTVLVLIDSNSREVIKSVIGFIRVSVAAIPPEQLEPLIPVLVEGLTRFHKPKNRFRAKIKIILKKLVKRFGYDALMPYVPESESKLLTHMRKLSQRQERKKETMSAQRRDDMTAFDDMLESDEEDSDDGRTLTSGTTRQTALKSGKSRMTQKTKGTMATSATSRQGPTTLRLPSDASGEIVDMLGVKHTRNVQFAEDTRMGDDSDSDDALEFDDDGRLVIRDDTAVAMDVVEDMPLHRQKKQRTDADSRTASSKSRQGTKASKASEPNQLGSSYKSKRAGGDVKRKGQTLEPYAYVPLDGRMYSKKNRHNAVGQMSSVVKSGGKRKR